jgi:hypothetical protein
LICSFIFSVSTDVRVFVLFLFLFLYTWRTDTANQRGGEWMGADKNSSRWRWRLQQDQHSFQHTSLTHYPSWPRPCRHWSATGPRNQLPTSQTRERSGTQTTSLTELHRSGWWAPPVRPVPAGETKWLPQNNSYTGQAGAAHRSDQLKPESPKTPNRPTELQTDPNSKQQQHGTTENLPKHSPEKKPNWGLHRSDRWEAPVRPVWPGLSGWTTPEGQLLQNKLPISRIAPRICARLWG